MIQVWMLATGLYSGAIEALLSASVECSIVLVSRAPLALNHLDVQGRLAHIQRISISLNETKKKLQDNARKTPLLVRMSGQAPGESKQPDRRPPF